MPSYSETQRKFMGAELSRLRTGKSTRTNMSEAQLREFASKPIRKRVINTRISTRKLSR